MKQNPEAKEFLKSLKAVLNLNIKKDISEENLIKLLEKNANKKASPEPIPERQNKGEHPCRNLS